MIPTRVLQEMGRRNFKKVIAYGQMTALDAAHVLYCLTMDRSGYTPVAVRQKAASDYLKMFIPAQHMVAVAAHMNVLQHEPAKWEKDMAGLSKVVLDNPDPRTQEDVVMERIYDVAQKLGHDPKEVFKMYVEQGENITAPVEFVDAEVVNDG
jgi:hypothetical protein